MKKSVRNFIALVLILTISLSSTINTSASLLYDNNIDKKIVKNEPKEPMQIVVNNYVVDNTIKERSYSNNDCDYVSIDTNECFIETSTFNYDDMWSQTIWFKEGSYRKIRTDGKIALENVARFLQDHLDAKIVLEGYASRRCGTYRYNKDLASNRLRTISSYLVNTYHINWDRIEMRP